MEVSPTEVDFGDQRTAHFLGSGRPGPTNFLSQISLRKDLDTGYKATTIEQPKSLHPQVQPQYPGMDSSHFVVRVVPKASESNLVPQARVLFTIRSDCRRPRVLGCFLTPFSLPIVPSLSSCCHLVTMLSLSKKTENISIHRGRSFLPHAKPTIYWMQRWDAVLAQAS